MTSLSDVGSDGGGVGDVATGFDTADGAGAFSDGGGAGEATSAFASVDGTGVGAFAGVPPQPPVKAKRIAKATKDAVRRNSHILRPLAQAQIRHIGRLS